MLERSHVADVYLRVVVSINIFCVDTFPECIVVYFSTLTLVWKENELFLLCRRD